MIKRPAFCACGVLCAATGLVLFQATITLAEPEGEEGGQSALKSECSRKLDAM
jgi:hypothetical protein